MLDPSPEFVVRAYFDAWTNQNIERALSYVAENVEWRMHIDQQTIGFAGIAKGREGLRQRMDDALTVYELVAFDVKYIDFVGQNARTQVRADYRHRASGQILDLTIRSVFRVVAKEIVEVDEYHDADRIRAFVAMAESSAVQSPPLARRPE